MLKMDGHQCRAVYVVYENIGGETYHLIYPSTILACLGVVVIIPIYIFYWKGDRIRLRSQFAQELEVARQERLRAKRRGSSAEKDNQSSKHVEKV